MLVQLYQVAQVRFFYKFIKTAVFTVLLLLIILLFKINFKFVVYFQAMISKLRKSLVSNVLQRGIFSRGRLRQKHHLFAKSAKFGSFK